MSKNLKIRQNMFYYRIYPIIFSGPVDNPVFSPFSFFYFSFPFSFYFSFFFFFQPPKIYKWDNFSIKIYFQKFLTVENQIFSIKEIDTKFLRVCIILCINFVLQNFDWLCYLFITPLIFHLNYISSYVYWTFVNTEFFLMTLKMAWSLNIVM